MMKSIVSVANTEQNAYYPPHIFSEHYNILTNLLINKLVDIYPSDSTVLDILDPFVSKKPIMVNDGYVVLPDDFRNILGTPMIGVAADGNDCGCEETNFDEKIKQSGCNKIPVIMISQAEFAMRTQSTYKKPTFKNPVCYRSGDKQIKVCPYNLKAVEVMYVRQEKKVKYGYDLMPDDTFVFNLEKSIESEWTSAAFEKIFSGMFFLYTAYTRDNNIKDWALILNQNKIV
jgi:hypothetical protein